MMICDDFLLSYELVLLFAMFSIEVQISVGLSYRVELLTVYSSQTKNVFSRYINILPLTTYLLFGAPLPLLLLPSRTKKLLCSLQIHHSCTYFCAF